LERDWDETLSRWWVCHRQIKTTVNEETRNQKIATISSRLVALTVVGNLTEKEIKKGEVIPVKFRGVKRMQASPTQPRAKWKQTGKTICRQRKNSWGEEEGEGKGMELRIQREPGTLGSSPHGRVTE